MPRLVSRPLVVCLWLLVVFRVSAADFVPAFPGAEGAGAGALGGRDGDVYHVTTLANNGAGSLRNGISTANGPRTILFKVSGTIELQSDLSINKSFLTIAGQSAPGDGITLARRGVRVSDASDVILRHLRFRPGDADPSFEGDALWVVRATNVIVDHVSTSWSVDECLSVTWSTNVTVQWSLISESLNNSQHEKGQHGYGSLLRYGAGALTFHHNLYQHHNNRNPRLGDRIRLDFVNNVLYNWGARAGYSGSNADLADNPGGFTNRLNYVCNYLVAGPSSTTPATAFAGGSANTFIFQAGNFIDSDRDTVRDGVNTGWSMFNPAYTVAPGRHPLPPVATDSAPVAYHRVLALAGASRMRDAVDRRLIADVRHQTGRLVDAVGPADQPVDLVTNILDGASYVFVRGWPTLRSAPAPVDTDGDGMPDHWEMAVGLNRLNAADRNLLDATGHTRLENYLNWLAEPHALCPRGGSVILDLGAAFGGTTNLAFTLGTATNGAAVLLADGVRARFTATADFSGLAGVTVTATDIPSGISLGAVNIGVLVTTTNAPAPSLTASHDPGGFKLTVQGVAGPAYVLQTSANLTNWVSLETNPAPVPPFEWTAPIGPDRRFYRIRLDP